MGVRDGAVVPVGEGVCSCGCSWARDGCARLGVSTFDSQVLEISIVLCFSISLEGKVLALYKYPTSSFTYLLIYCHCPQKESEIVHY